MKDYRIAKLAAAVLRKDRSVVYCKHCQAAYLDGPEKCPRCKNVLVAASTLKEPEKKAEVKATIVEEAPKPCIYQQGERCWIRFRGQALPIESWCGKLGIGQDFLRQCIRRRKDITPLLLGNRPTKVNDLPDLEGGKEIKRKEKQVRAPVATSDEVYASASAVELMGNPRSEVEELPNPVATAEVVATAALTVVNHGSDDPIHVSILRGKLARFDVLKAEILKRREELAVLEKEHDRLIEELKEGES
jgi:hypothetical protein